MDAVLGQEGGSLRALCYLRRSTSAIPRTRIPPRLRRLTGDIGPAQKHFQAVLEMEAPEYLRGLARDGLRKIAARELKARGPRKDGGILSGWAQRLFRGKLLEGIREISFEISMLDRYGLDINDPQESHVLRALPRRTFSALELVCMCIMCAGFKRIEPGMDLSGWIWARSGGWRWRR